MPNVIIHVPEEGMAQPRLNKVIDLLEQGEEVFGGDMAWTGNIDEAMAFADKRDQRHLGRYEGKRLRQQRSRFSCALLFTR